MASMPERRRAAPIEPFQAGEPVVTEPDTPAECRPPEELHTIAKGAGISFAGKLVGGVAQYLYLILIARLIGTADFGLLILALTIVEFAGLVSRLGLEGGVVRFVSQNLASGDLGRVKGTIAAALGISFVSTCVFAVILALGADHLSLWLFGKPSLAEPLRYLSISLPFITLTVVSLNATQGFQRMDLTFYGQNLFSPFCNIALASLLIIVGPDLAKACSAYSTAACATAIFSLFLLSRAFPGAARVRMSAASSDLFRFGLPFLAAILLMYLMIWTDTLFMGHYRSSAEVGVYNAAMKSAFFINTILLCFSHIFSPIISNLHSAGETNKLHRLFKTVTRWTITACIPFFLIVTTFPGELLSVFGEGFAAGSIPLLILASAQLLNASTGPLTHMLVMSGRQNWMMFNTLAICIMNALLNWMLVPTFGGTGAAVASGCSTVAFNLAMLLEVRLLLGMNPYDTSILKPVTAGLAALLLTVALKVIFAFEETPLRMIVFGGIPLLAYVVIICRGELNEDDRIITAAIRQKWAAIRCGST